MAKALRAYVEPLRVTRKDGEHALRDRKGLYSLCKAKWVDGHFSTRAQVRMSVPRARIFLRYTDAVGTLWDRNSAGRIYSRGRYLHPTSRRRVRTLLPLLRSLLTVKQATFRRSSGEATEQTSSWRMLQPETMWTGTVEAGWTSNVVDPLQ